MLVTAFCGGAFGAEYCRPTGELQEKAQALADLAVKEGLQGALQFCAFKDGKCIVDVWAGTMTTNAGAAKIDGDTLFPIFSTEKPLLATAVHRSVEQGNTMGSDPMATINQFFLLRPLRSLRLKLRSRVGSFSVERGNAFYTIYMFYTARICVWLRSGCFRAGAETGATLR